MERGRARPIHPPLLQKPGAIFPDRRPTLKIAGKETKKFLEFTIIVNHIFTNQKRKTSGKGGGGFSEKTKSFLDRWQDL